MLATIKEFYGRFRRWVHWSKIDCKDRTHLWSPGVYIQDTPHIHIGKGVYCGPNVGIIVFNHCPKDPTKHFKAKDVYIGNYCWLGMNCVILPGVRLGDFTTVGAGAVVTKSFPEGYCVIAGVPAKIIKKFDGA